MVAQFAALSVAFALFAIAGLHAHWALGGTFPAPNATQLMQTVVGGKASDPMPGPLACWMVVLALVFGASQMLVLVRFLPEILPQGAATWIAWAMSAVFFVRGVAGFFETRFRPSIKGNPYERLNLVLYSPLCLALAILVLIATTGH